MDSGTKSTLTSRKPYFVDAYKNWLEGNDIGVLAEIYVEDTTAVVPKKIESKLGVVTIDITFDQVSDLKFNGQDYSFNQNIDGKNEFFKIPLDLIISLSPRGTENKDMRINFPYKDVIKEHRKVSLKPILKLVN